MQPGVSRARASRLSLNLGDAASGLSLTLDSADYWCESESDPAPAPPALAESSVNNMLTWHSDCELPTPAANDVYNPFALLRDPPHESGGAPPLPLNRVSAGLAQIPDSSGLLEGIARRQRRRRCIGLGVALVALAALVSGAALAARPAGSSNAGQALLPSAVCGTTQC